MFRTEPSSLAPRLAVFRMDTAPEGCVCDLVASVAMDFRGDRGVERGSTLSREWCECGRVRAYSRRADEHLPAASRQLEPCARAHAPRLVGSSARRSASAPG